MRMRMNGPFISGEVTNSAMDFAQRLHCLAEVTASVSFPRSTYSKHLHSFRLNWCEGLRKNFETAREFPAQPVIAGEGKAFMSKVRVLVGTKKGAFILTSDAKRDNWEVSGPFFAGWEIYHMKGSPVDPERIYVSQTSGWFGQLLQASTDGGKTWFQPGVKPENEAPQWPPVKSNRFAYDSSDETGKPSDHTPVVRRHAKAVGV